MLLAAAGVEIDIRIAGYEFIDNPTDDPNWLLFEGRVRHPRGNWQFRVPAMEVLEAVRLADWLDAVRQGTEDVPWCLFADSYLAFGTPGGFEPRVLQVFFGREARAPWNPPGTSHSVDLPLAAIDLETAVESLRMDLLNFPQRNES